MRKRLYSLWFSAVFLALLCVPTLAWAASGNVDVILFHTNDTHARVVQGDDDGASVGLAELAAVVKATRKQHADTLWFDAGDTLHGMPRINVSRGENIVPLLNAAGIDALSPGNHDYNYSAERLQEIAKKTTLTILSANTVERITGSYIFPPTHIYKMSNGVKIGVFGLTSPETGTATSPTNVKNVRFTNPVDAAKEMIKVLRPECDVIVGVMHMGLDNSSEFTSERIAKEAPGIDIIVDGHSHTTLPEGMLVNQTLIVQAGCHGHKLGRVELTIRDHKLTQAKATLLDAAAMQKIAPKPDQKILDILQDIEKRNATLLGKVIAHNDRHLTSERTIVRRQEAELGNFCADAFRWRAESDIALINGGGMRSDLPAGDITQGDVLAIFPFGNSLLKVAITGEALRAALEHGVSEVPASFGGFLHVSGMRFSFDPLMPVGKRVYNVYVGDEPLDDSRTYTLAMYDFLHAGGNDYTMLAGLPVLMNYETGEVIITEYLATPDCLKNIDLGRITVGTMPGVVIDYEEDEEDYAVLEAA